MAPAFEAREQTWNKNFLASLDSMNHYVMRFFG